MKAMKASTCIAAVVSILLLVPSSMFASRITDQPNPIEGEGSGGRHEHSRWPKARNDQHTIEADFPVERRLTKLSRAETLRVAGSKIPDCSHACGSCAPCRLVVVRFACTSPAEAETCPVAYKCMCNGKSYPVP